jgi:hypothetical protein
MPSAATSGSRVEEQASGSLWLGSEPVHPATVGPDKAEQIRPCRSATPARPSLSQLHFYVIGRFDPQIDCRIGLGLALCPRGVLAAGVERCPLRVDPACGLVRAGLQLI